MKVIKRIAYSFIRQVVTINWSTVIQMTLSLLQTPWKNVSVDC